MTTSCGGFTSHQKAEQGFMVWVLWVNQATHREGGDDALTFRDVALLRRWGENPSWRKGWEMRHPLQLLLMWWQNNDPHHHHPGYRSPNSSHARSFSCPYTPQQQNIDCVWWGACFLLSGSDKNSRFIATTTGVGIAPGNWEREREREREWRTHYLGNFILVGWWSLKC
jgi:hypothetical protein